MSVTILEVLQNADYNLKGQMPQIQLPMAKEQLSNAVKALENGWGVDETFTEEMLTTEKPD